MGVFGSKLRSTLGGFAFYCPGCKSVHAVRTNIAGTHEGNCWSFNYNGDAPTFAPSILVKSGHYGTSDNPNCWCTYEARTGNKSPFKCEQCHSYITDGKIQFLGDCSHALAGQTVDLPDFSEGDD